MHTLERPSTLSAEDAPPLAPATQPAIHLPHRLTEGLRRAGVRINGAQPWDIRIRDQRVTTAVRRHGLTGLGEAYINGWWECDAIDNLFCRLLRASIPALFRNHPHVVRTHLLAALFNQQTPPASKRQIHAHYDTGADVFSRILDPRMTYSCGYWRDASTLAEAQEQKLDLVCRKLGLKPGMRVLDIGCGWGSWVKFAAERYGVHAVGVTLSREQAAFARQNCAELNVEIKLQDYRTLEGRFDRIASIGMFEHVGPKNYVHYMDVARRCLDDDGLFVLHTFAAGDRMGRRNHSEVEWINRHIFPGLVVPSLGQIGRAIDGRFVVEDLHNFGADYDPTLLAWHENFEQAWPALRSHYDERFRRIWRYYLLSCAGAFRSRVYQVWQLVLTKSGVPGGYPSVR